MSKQASAAVDLQAIACCAPLAASPMDAAQAAAVAPMFKALGEPVRLRLMSLIASAPEVCVCDLTAVFDLSGPTISHHLKVLRDAGLVRSQRRATWVWYQARPDALRLLGSLLECSTATLDRQSDHGDRDRRPDQGNITACQA